MLPFCHIVLHAQKPLPDGYPIEPKTIGDYIKRRRLDLKLSQRNVAEFVGISKEAVSDWEANTVSPRAAVMPKVIEFLGHNPFTDLTGISEGEKIRIARKLLGLTKQQAALKLGVSVSTFSSWEKGRGIKKNAYQIPLESFIRSANLF